MGDQWILDVKSELECSNPEGEVQAWRKRSIYKVPEAFTRFNHLAFVPDMASFGPYHHGQPQLMPMESHKRRALVNFLSRAKKPLEDIVVALREEVQQLMGSYDMLEERWAQDENKFLELMIVDGCFMLEVMLTDIGGRNDEETEGGCNRKSDSKLSRRYDEKDPVFSKPYVMIILWLDMLKLENQLPLRVLSILADFAGDEINSINGLILKFCYLDEETEKFGAIQEPGLHLLDIYRKAMLLHGDYWISSTTHARSAVELLEAGIRFCCSKSTGFKDISFNSSKGILSLPYMEIDDTFEPILRNLVAFEQLHGAGQEVTAFIFFMDGIVNTGKDVALLREKEIIKVVVGSDDDIASLFNRLTKEITVEYKDDDGEVDVNEELSDYCSTRWHEWRANFVHTYLRNPWVFSSLVAALILLVLTVVQTVYTLLAYY